MKWVILTTLALTVLSNNAQSKQILCVPDKANGFLRKEKTDNWNHTTYDVTDKYLISEIKQKRIELKDPFDREAEYTIKIIGTDIGFPCNTLRNEIHCEIGSSNMFWVIDNRYVFANIIEFFWDNSTKRNISIEFGKCSEL